LPHRLDASILSVQISLGVEASQPFVCAAGRCPFWVKGRHWIAAH
jgi:hypothetical protein